MRPIILFLLIACTIGCVPSNASAATIELKTCTTRDKAEQVVQSRGAVVPDDCRTVTVTSITSPAGEMCKVQFADQPSGIVGSVTDAITQTEWWTACSNIRAP